MIRSRRFQGLTQAPLFRRINRHSRLLLQLVLATAISVFLLQFHFHVIESYFQDLRIEVAPVRDPSPQVVLVVFDQQTVAELKGVPSFSHHEQVLQRLLKMNPSALAYTFPLTAEGTRDDDLARAQSSPSGDDTARDSLISVLEDSPQVFQLSDKMALPGEFGSLALPTPFQNVRVLSAPRTADQNLFAADGVTRRLIIDYGGHPLGHQVLAEMALGRPLVAVRGVFDVYETRQVLINFAKPGRFQTYRFEDLLLRPVELDLRGKVVLIGDDIGKTLRSYIKTPFSQDPSAMTILEMHANMLHTLITNSAPVRPRTELTWILTLLVSVLTIHAVLTLRPLRGLLLLMGIAAGYLGISFAAFALNGWLLPVAHPLVAAFLCYYFFIPYRLIVENRRSWEFQQKHQLLKQVEELKTNFISMMSHDLKTPIARIQGMTEVLVRDPVVLSNQQREAIDHIRSSSEDLLRFVNATLNFARIESEGVTLHRQSCDLNDLVEKVVQRHDFLAKAKHIEIRKELEPLFPISGDPDLLKQVISNLIENAIKYSPQGSRILVSTEENQGRVSLQVADQGEGIPADELPQVFMKFFRSRSAKTSSVKGSGLGLYLAQYFVQLHGGHLSVESEVGVGTTFTLELPSSPSQA